jgi:hypothetical protein
MKIDILFISFNRKEEIIYNINIFSNYEQINMLFGLIMDPQMIRKTSI